MCAMWCRFAAVCSAPFASPRHLEGVEGRAHGAVTDGMHVHLEAPPVELGDVLAQRHRVDERDAGVVGDVPCRRR